MIYQRYEIKLTYASKYVIILQHFLLVFLTFTYVIYDMKTTKKRGRKALDDPREPFNLRLKRSLLEVVRQRAKEEKRAMNTIVEMILEKELL